VFVSVRRLQELRLENLKTTMGSSICEDVGFGVINFYMIFNDTYRINRPIISFRAINIDQKCKHLLHFPTVTLRALC
jgi:hypothetical protein